MSSNEDFRKLLATTPVTTGSSAGPSSSRAFGSDLKRSAAASSSKVTTNDFLPRKTQKKTGNDRPRPPPKNSATGEVYIDRAKARRTGDPSANDEFAEVEKLHQEWKNRYDAAQTDEERREIEEQMRFLGGDAVHSVLVRGLDYSLLAQHKAKAEGTIEVTDDDLEQAYAQAAYTNGSPDRQAEGSGGRRSRADILASLKDDRAAAGSSSPIETGQDRDRDAQQARDEELERAKRMGKFRPIGFQEVKNSKDDDVIITKDGKRLRKKKKKVQPEEPGQANATQAAPIPPKKPVIEQPKVAAPSSSSRSRPSQPSTLVPPKVKTTSAKSLQKVEASPPATTSTTAEANERPSHEDDAAVPAVEDPVQHATSPDVTTEEAITAPNAPDEDSDDDIFAGAAQYTGFVDSDDEDDDEEQSQGQKAGVASKDAPSISSSATVGKQDWFAESKSTSGGAEEDATPSTSSADPRVSSILASLRAGPSSTTDNQSDNAQKPVDDEDEAALPRLQGLSGSSLSNEHMKMMLQREKDEAQREKERSEWWKKKKKGGKGKQGDAGDEAED